MSPTIAQKLELAQIRADRAEESLKEADFNLKGGMFRTAVNRRHNAVLYAAMALLILKGIDPVKHEGSQNHACLRI